MFRLGNLCVEVTSATHLYISHGVGLNCSNVWKTTGPNVLIKISSGLSISMCKIYVDMFRCIHILKK